MSFISVLKTIGEDIEKGITAAAPIIGAFVPGVGAILTEIATVIADLESKGQTVNASELSAIVQALSTTSAISQAKAAPASNASAPAPTGS